MKRKSKYPKNKITKFVEMGEYDCPQVNLHVGRVYTYWSIQPNEYCIKLLKGELPDYFKNKTEDETVKKLLEFSKI